MVYAHRLRHSCNFFLSPRRIVLTILEVWTRLLYNHERGGKRTRCASGVCVGSVQRDPQYTNGKLTHCTNSKGGFLTIDVAFQLVVRIQLSCFFDSMGGSSSSSTSTAWTKKPTYRNAPAHDAATLFALPSVKKKLFQLYICWRPVCVPRGGMAWRNPRLVEVVVALGGNLGSPLGAFESALARLERKGVLHVSHTSSLYRSKPVGQVLDQPLFLNAAVRATTSLDPKELMRQLQAEEDEARRTRDGPIGGPRTLDLDLVFYGNHKLVQGEVKDGPGKWIHVPHPRWKEREFVLAPLVELLDKGEDESERFQESQDRMCVKMLGMAKRRWIELGGEKLLREKDAPLRRVCAMKTPRCGDGYGDVHPVQNTNIGGDAHSLYAPGARTMVMGILNLTPDSFSDGSPKAMEPQHVLDNARRMVEEGADVLDLGAQSTRPGSQPINAKEELQRLMPALDRVLRDEELKGVPISVDTYLAQVARTACDAGTHIINDVGGGALDPFDPLLATSLRDQDQDAPLPSSMWEAVAQAGNCPAYVMTHSRSHPSRMMQDQRALHYDMKAEGPAPVVGEALVRKVHSALNAKLYPWRMLWDPGFGFAKDSDTNLALLRNLGHIRKHMEGSKPLKNAPMLVGISRKAFIGKITGLTNPKDRDLASHAALVACVAGGADIVRVHDVRGAWAAARVADAVWKGDTNVLK